MRAPHLLLVAAVVIAGCTAGAGPSPTSSPTSSPAFALDVVPAEDPAAVRTAIPGQGVCFLVVVGDEPGAAVAITASASGATIRSIEPAELDPGTVGEVWVVPGPATAETTAYVTITGTRDGVTQTVERSLPVFPMADERRADAQPHFDRWVAWLAEAHPELGISVDTEWAPEFVSTLLVVSHYAYWSDEWEATVAWHNMIAPYDWSEIHLRHRWDEAAPSLAFRIDSVSGATAPHAVAPPAVVVR